MPLYSFNNVVTLFSSTTSTSTTGLVEETLLSYTLKASQLAVNGRGVRISAWGTTAANANNKTFRIYFGATVVQVQAGGASALPWFATATVLRASATTQVATGNGNFSGIALNTSNTSPGETLSGTVLIKVTGTTPTLLGDLTQSGLLIELV